MKPEDEHESERATPEGPQRVWQSLHREEEPGMEMRLTTDQLCAMARYRERENIWVSWIAAAVCAGFGAAFMYWAIRMDQIWLRLAQTWMALLMGLATWGAMGWRARRIEAGESCAQFMVRELEGSRRTLLALRWGIVLVLPWMAMLWWGASGVIRAALHLDPASWRYYFPTSPWPFVAVLPVLLACWAGLGLEAKKRARQADELRRAIGG